MTATSSRRARARANGSPVPAGYTWIIQQYHLKVLSPSRLSFIGDGGLRREVVQEGQTTVTYPPQYHPGKGLVDHLEFALKHEGTNLHILTALFAGEPTVQVEQALVSWIVCRPTGRYARKLWFLYELLTGRRLPLEDAKRGNYVPLLEPDEYYSATPERSPRHRVLDNLLGNADFCPMVRKTVALEQKAALGLAEEARRLVASYDEDVLRRAVSYLYTKETRSSFSIEGENPGAGRTERFITVLKEVEQLPSLDEAELVRLQNAIMEDGAGDEGYRREPVFVGEQLDLSRQLIHYIAPRPEDVPRMMDGLLRCMSRMNASAIDPVVQAAAAAFGFVFVHPFSDGNGRLHRLLIHHALSRAGFTPPGIVFPISAVILSKRREYDDALESVSRPVMRRVEYEELEDGAIGIENATANLYRYLDYTRFAEDLYRWTEETIRTELKNELDFIVHYRDARARIEALVDLPDRLLNNFIKIVVQNGGRLSNAKRAMFARLTDEQVAKLEAAVREAYGLGG